LKDDGGLEGGGSRKCTRMDANGGPGRGVSSEVFRGEVVGLEGGVVRRSTQIYADGWGRELAAMGDWTGYPRV